VAKPLTGHLQLARRGAAGGAEISNQMPVSWLGSELLTSHQLTKHYTIEQQWCRVQHDPLY